MLIWSVESAALPGALGICPLEGGAVGSCPVESVSRLSVCCSGSGVPSDPPYGVTLGMTTPSGRGSIASSGAVRGLAWVLGGLHETDGTDGSSVKSAGIDALAGTPETFGVTPVTGGIAVTLARTPVTIGGTPVTVGLVTKVLDGADVSNFLTGDTGVVVLTGEVLLGS